jgi:hypothetical protein
MRCGNGWVELTIVKVMLKCNFRVENVKINRIHFNKYKNE